MSYLRAADKVLVHSEAGEAVGVYAPPHSTSQSLFGDAPSVHIHVSSDTGDAYGIRVAKEKKSKRKVQCILHFCACGFDSGLFSSTCVAQGVAHVPG
jgi:hypothetical protein